MWKKTYLINLFFVPVFFIHVKYRHRKLVCPKLLHNMIENAPVCFKNSVIQMFISYKLYV